MDHANQRLETGYEPIHVDVWRPDLWLKDEAIYTKKFTDPPYQSLQRNIDYRWPSNSPVGQRPALQFLGIEEDKITLSGELLPEITGGRLSLLMLETMADQGKAWPLIEGSGTIYGVYVVNSISQTKTEFFSDGCARKISFSVTLTRVDASLSDMLGDLRQQAGELLDNASAQAGKAQSAIGGLFE